MSQRSGSEAESGIAATARVEPRDEVRPGPRLALASNNAEQNAPAVPVEHIGALTAAELTELARLSEPELRGVQSGAFNKRFGQSELDWSALRTPTPIPPPMAAEPALPSAVQAFYGKSPAQPERAELTIGNLSLDLANPFLGSSLLPPPPKKRPWLSPLLISLAACLLIGAGYVGALWTIDRNGVITALGLENYFQLEATPAQAAAPSTPQVTVLSESAPASHAISAPAEPAAVHAPAANHAAAPATEPSAAPVSSAALATETQPSAASPAVEPSAEAVAPAAPRARGRRARMRAAAALAAVSAPLLAAKAAEAKPVAASKPAPVATTKPAVPAVKPVSAAVAASATTAAPRATGPVAQELSRAQVQNGLEGVRASLQTCAAGTHGRAVANVTISGAGRVSYASIEGAFAGTPQGSCMARALRAAQFPQFASPQLRVRYPFAF